MIVDKMINSVSEIMHHIQQHAFNKELASGTLAREKFSFYLVQDALYLADFSRALALTAARLPDTHHARKFIQFSHEAINVERDLHLKYLAEHQSMDLLKTEQNPTCFMYTNYLIKMATTASVEEAVSSLLPCFWVYGEVGKIIAATQCANNPYSDWIAMYSSDQFNTTVKEAIQIINEVGNASPEHTKVKMISAFKRATHLEWLFWQSVYDHELGQS
jgi:thiaminase/transcriptional activator TenA